MTIEEAQRDLRRAYVGGGPGAAVSGLLWLAAAGVEAARGTEAAFTTLFFGGMAIFPVATLLCRRVFGRAAEVAGNPMGRIALESTVAMIGGLLAAWLLMPHRPDQVFALAAVAVGTHYAAFRSAYGDALFWVLAAAITGAACLALFAAAPVPGGVILWVAAIELAFGIALTWRALRPS